VAVRVFAEEILNEFPDVAVHVVNAPGIRQLLTAGMELAARVAAVPADLVQIGDGVATVVSRGRAGPARIFPLRLGRQLHRPTRLFAEFLAELLCILPRNVVD